MVYFGRAIFFLVCLFAVSVTLQAQELSATVTVNTQPLTLDQSQDVINMANVVRDYLHSNRYTGSDWVGAPIPVDITIYLNARNGNTFSARLSVVSKRLVNNVPESGSGLLRVFDQAWTFEWSNSPTLTYQPLRYDPFTSVIDFYMLIAIGLDMDTYDDLAGTQMFRAGLQIAQAGNAAGISQFSTVFQPGQFTRMSLITELTDNRYDGLRRLIFDYQDAIDVFGRDQVKGRTELEAVIHDVSEFKRTKISNRSVLLQSFFDAKILEICDVFRGYAGAQIWADLRFLDAGNTQQYEAARQAK